MAEAVIEADGGDCPLLHTDSCRAIANGKGDQSTDAGGVPHPGHPGGIFFDGPFDNPLPVGGGGESIMNFQAGRAQHGHLAGEGRQCRVGVGHGVRGASAQPGHGGHGRYPTPRPEGRRPVLSAWHAVNCLRELRGDNHWALLAAAGIDDVEAGLLHSAMVDPADYGDEEWIARSRGGDDQSVAAAWSRLEARGLAVDGRLSDAGRALRLDLERRTDELTAPVWQAIGETATVKLLDLVEPPQDAFVQRINETAGPRWMPAVRPGGSAVV